MIAEGRAAIHQPPILLAYDEHFEELAPLTNCLIFYWRNIYLHVVKELHWSQTEECAVGAGMYF